MLYFTLVAKSSSSDTLYCVGKPTKNSDGLYTVTPKKYKTLDGKITIPASGLNGFIVPEVSSDDSGWNLNTTSYTVKETMSYDSIKSFSGISNNEIKAIKGMMSIFDYNSVYYFDNSAQVLAQGRLFLKHHNKGQWSCTKTVYLDNGKQTVKAGSVTINQDNIAIQSDKVIAQGGTYKNSLAYNQRGGSIYGHDLYKISKTEYVFTLTFETLLLAPANQWELGSIAGGANTWPGSYCFYCNDPFEGLHDHIKYFLGDANLSIQSSDKDKLHKPTAHGGSSSSSSSASYNDTTSSTVYNGYTNNSSYSSDSLKKVSRLEYGKTGVYQDGVATVPYVMMELRDSLEATTGYNLSIPANTFVSLTHERNLSDSYNTFSLQLFDKDAMQVEAKILLGWRYIAFYYTDFVSTSKRFKGEILDYKTVITGKGLMLTLTGYSTNVSSYIFQDSIPWSKMVQSGTYAFYYWKNDAGEYHGDIKYITDDNGTIHYNSSDGSIFPIIHNTDRSMLKTDPDLTYELKATDPNDPTKSYWTTFDDYYSEATQEDKDKYRPKSYIWSLEQYNSSIDNVLAGDPSFNLSNAKPSDIVILICIINKWKFNFSDIVETRSVTTIPDQVNKSYTEYIKESLIPISASKATGNVQYYFWFDDDGYAHYAPRANEDAKKSLYFNAGKDKPDSYQLIGFTASTNGSTLLLSDATQLIDAINIYTGDTLNVQVIKTEKDDTFTQAYHLTEEWFASNVMTKKNNSSQSNVSSKDYISYSNSTGVPSEEDLKTMLKYRYGKVSKYTYKATLDVYACSDLTPGQSVNIYIYLDDGARSSDAVSTTIDKDKGLYKGNITLHHSSGKYFINKITDTISGGKYISSLEVIKIDEGKLDTISSKDSDDDYNKTTSEETTCPLTQTSSNTSTSIKMGQDQFNDYNSYNNLFNNN